MATARDPFFIHLNDLILTSTTLGSGSFGSVYQGEWSNQTVAIKKITHQGDSGKLIACERENEILKLISHPNIVAFFGYSLSQSSYYFITELIPKGSLRKVINRRELVDVTISYKIMKDITGAVVYLHSKNIAHCDLKTENVLIDDQYNGKLCDFGLAKIMDGEMHSVGTPVWLAPEIYLYGIQTEKTDVYSLALVFYEIISSKKPYDEFSGTLPEFIRHVCRGEKPTIPSNCPPKIAKLITWGFQSNPEKRPTAKELAVEQQTNIDTISVRLASIR